LALVEWMWLEREQQRQTDVVGELAALVEEYEPDEAAWELAHLEGRLIDRLCRPGTEADGGDGVPQGLAYWLLRDALSRRAEDVV
jgi:hypothetical protein